MRGGYGVRHLKNCRNRALACASGWERAFERLAPPPQVEISSLPLMPKLIARTALLIFTSRQNLTRTNCGENLVELPFPEMTWERHFGIFTRKGSYIPTASQMLVDRIVQAAAEIE